MAIVVPAELARLLHRMHRQLSDLRDRASRGPKVVQARQANLTRLNEELTRIQTDQKNAKLRYDQKQLLLKSTEEKIEKHKAQLNGCQSNREYQALKDQIAADQKACEVLSDEILDSLERVDEFKTQSQEAEQNITAAKEELAKVQQQVSDQNAVLTEEMTRVEAELAKQEVELDPEIREIYHRLVRSKGHDAMAEVQDQNFCGGCCQRLTPNLMAELAMQRTVICKNCGRLIYLPESTAR